MSSFLLKRALVCLQEFQMLLLYKVDFKDIKVTITEQFNCITDYKFNLTLSNQIQSAVNVNHLIILWPYLPYRLGEVVF